MWRFGLHFAPPAVLPPEHESSFKVDRDLPKAANTYANANPFPFSLPHSLSYSPCVVLRCVCILRMHLSSCHSAAPTTVEITHAAVKTEQANILKACQALITEEAAIVKKTNYGYE